MKRRIKCAKDETGVDRRWISFILTAPKYRDEMDRAVQYVIYRFDAKREKVDISDPSHIVSHHTG